MEDRCIYAVTPQHMLAFGTIIQWFARHEVLMQMLTARLLGADLYHTIAVTSGLGYQGKRDALQILIKGLPQYKADAVDRFLGELHKRNALRNRIAHATWTEGTRPNTIKPMSVIVRGGSGRPLGINENEEDYTPKELLDIANELGELYNDFRDFALKEGLMPAMTENRQANNSEISSAPGSPSAK